MTLKKKLKEYYEKEALEMKDHQKLMYYGSSWNRYWHGTRLYQILKIVKDIHPKNFLDVGCAEGYYLKLLTATSNFEGFYGVGLDIAKNYLLKAKKKAPSGLLVVGDAYNLPFKNHHFSLVLCFAKRLRLIKPENPFVEVGHGHLHELRTSKTIVPWSLRTGCKCVNSIITCYFPLSFLQKHRIPAFFLLIIKFADKILSKLPVVKGYGAVQIVLLQKSNIVLNRLPKHKPHSKHKLTTQRD